MQLNTARVGIAMCGSFCTFKEAFDQFEILAPKCQSLLPIMSEIASATTTRFGSNDFFVSELERICGVSPICTIAAAEPVGPKKLLDLLIIAPCTGNTIAKLANGVTDSAVTMAAKAHLRNQKPLLIAVSTNDGLSASAKNIGVLQNTKNVFFVPYKQDDPITKPTSLVADLNYLEAAARSALLGQQLQPLLLGALV